MYSVLKFLLIIWDGAERWQKYPMNSCHVLHVKFSEGCIRSVRVVSSWWNQRRANRSAARGAKLQGALKPHWNNRKYGTSKHIFLQANDCLLKLLSFWHAQSERFASLFLGRESLKIIGLKGRQIICQPIVVPSPSYRTHTPQVQNYAAIHRPSTRQTSVNHRE